MTAATFRFAPSPTGRLHLGNLRSALLGWLWARQVGGRFLLRIEDLDRGRCRPEFTDFIFEDLEWLGLTWDGEVLLQSQRTALYDAHLEQLREKGLAYPCWCTRAEVARAASAPHVGEDGPVYPGTCRERVGPPPEGRSAAWRFRVAPGVVTVTDVVHGEVSQDVARDVGDFVIRRNDGVASYQLAVVVDDNASGVTHVLRGEDLLSSTPRQALLQAALGFTRPTWAHVPLLMQSDGKRLAKRDGTWTLAGLRALGWAPERVVGLLAKWSGLGDGAAVRSEELVSSFDLAHVRRDATVVDPEFAS